MRDTDHRSLPGIKQRDLSRCLRCDKGVMHDRSPMFYRVRIERYCVDVAAVRQQHGLEMMIGPLAGVMGTDADIAKQIYSNEFLLCDTCAGSDEAIVVYDDVAQNRRSKP